MNHVRGEVCAHEALSRPQIDGHAIAPDVWFRAAVACNRAREVDQLVVTLSMKSFALAWSETPPTPLFVNVTPSSLTEKFFLEYLEVLFEKGIFSPEQLVIEIVEYIPYDVTYLSTVIQTVRSRGVRIALDDVGVGSNTFSSVAVLEPDWVKVDRTLIRGISGTPAKQEFLSRLVQIMGSGERIIAEGIETHEDLETIRSMGIFKSQGYYWSAPLSVPQIQSLLQTIEQKRHDLLKLVETTVWTDPTVLAKSEEVDRLVTLYYRLWNKAKSAG
ncbi:EAL domain-containing protein [Alicyclobacillus sendaiensis]|uniref:EAL domain-containing protein n=1 Tax=Alicyclobacillus sendaiensis TaxID=192387 RepID=UPI0026F46B99|nr:EAL domain-containing protein [Alicyclobacillus sendaiensis]